MKPFLLVLLTAYSLSVLAQDRPKLVVGLVVDQMTNDYLYRFAEDFSDNGFNRLLNQGYYFPNTTYNYMATSTGPGHASIYTGSTPSSHGIVENVYYDYAKKESMYCVDDPSVRGLGTTDKSGARSPINLETATVTDMFSLSSKPEAKIIGIAMKDRSAILTAGHAADMAFWWDNKSATWISSTYYALSLPKWLNEFHKEHPLSNYLTNWSSTFEMTEAEKKEFVLHDQYEFPLGTKLSTAMPYNLEKIALVTGSSLLKSTPQGNTYSLNFAKKAIVSESMGKDDVSDFLCLSLSSTDYIGHKFGPYSEEVKDTYVRLDKDLAAFLNFLDKTVGENNYLFFLTSDHGVVPNVGFLKSKKMPAAQFDLSELQEDLNTLLFEQFEDSNLVMKVADNQVYLDMQRVKQLPFSLNDITRAVADQLNERDDVLLALTSYDLTYNGYSEFPAKEMKASYYNGRSGQVLFTFKNFMRSNQYEKGTGHGTVFNYDRNVPLIFYGKNIKPGKSYENVEITQIAATLADLLNIQRPPSCTSHSLAQQVLKD